MAKKPTNHPRDELRARSRRLGDVIRSYREAAELTQTELGVLLAPHIGEEIPQTSLSRWEKGMVNLDVNQVWAIEKALKLPAGTILEAAGYVDNTRTAREVEAILRNDNALEPLVRESMVQMYRTHVQLSKQIRRSGPPAGRR